MPSLETATTSRASAPGLQPFQCSICGKRFTRHENLKRHVAIHTNSENSTPFTCSHCSTTFSRQDLRRRHIKRKHPEVANTRESPNEEAEAQEDEPMGPSGMFDYSEGEPAPTFGQWVASQPAPPNPQSGSASTDLASIFDFPDIATGFTPRGLTIEELSAPPAGAISDVIRSNSFSQQIPDRDRSGSLGQQVSPPSVPSFNRSGSFGQQISPHMPSESFGSARPHSHTSLSISPGTPLNMRNPLLDPSTISHGINLFFTHVAHYCPFIHQPTFDPSTTPDVLLLAMLSVSTQFGPDIEEGKTFGRRCSAQARKLLEDMDESTCSPALNLQSVQACLLLQLSSIMLVGGKETKHGLRLHARCIEMVRLCGLTEPYPTQPDSADDLDTLWAQFARAESHKRTFFGVYQLDATWYQVLSTPRHMSHLEIKHEMPCNEQLWAAPSVTAWAHRTLVERSKPLPKYIAAIRNCLTPSPATDHVLDAHGSLLVIFFLLSSVREVSGWSTMTGRVCFERFEALHASLKGLEPRVCGKSGSPMDLFTEAMWHMAMMDLLLWSPAHTQGVVEYSIDAAIAAAIHFGISQPVAISVESLNPHLQWYLTYLNTTPLPDLEPPWITIYAFKAALVAWQLVRSGMTDHVQTLGVVDAKGMCAWIRRCFEGRKHWGIGRLVLNSMDDLEMASL